MIIKEFHIQLNKDEVLRSIDCYEESPLYEELCEEYDQWINKVHAMNDACAFLVISNLPFDFGLEDQLLGKRAVYVLLTLGEQIAKECERLFQEGDYLSGLLVSAIADHYLFQMERELEPNIRDMCKGSGIGIAKRLEVPEDLPMEFQKVIYEETQAKQMGMKLNESYVLSPFKSITYAYLASDDTNEFQLEHNCKRCKVMDCKIKKAKSKKITIHHEKGHLSIWCFQGESIMEAIQREHVPTVFPCGGRGVCGKCIIQVIGGTSEVGKEDIEFLTTAQMEKGFRLACKAYPREDCEIKLYFQKDEEHVVLSEFQLADSKKLIHEPEETFMDPSSMSYGIGIDIGTTTLVMQLVERNSKKILDTYSTINSQRRYGTDVISRIQAQINGMGRELQEAILQDIRKGIEKWRKNNQIDKIVVAGNTTMIHLLLGLPCKGLGEYPFQPVTIDRVTGGGELLGMPELNTKVVIYPGISAFVGGDIVSGLMACEFHKKSSVSMLIDLGTNGEMVIGNANRLMCTSTAAGPAFEGGNLSCGIGSVPGAIFGLALGESNIVKTIGNVSPIGICGTGIVEAIAEFLKLQVIDETGLYEDDYFEEGYVICENNETNVKIKVTQRDIREFQLAKSAIRTGVELLVERYETSYEELDKVYLAGGFGYAINIEKAIQVGLFPSELKEKLQPVGNASLSGALKELYEECGEIEEDSCVENATELSLSMDKKFNELYVNYMYFE